MKVLLLKDYVYLGKAGEIVNVKDGYARNYLIPQKIATPLSPGLQKQLDNLKKSIEIRNQKLKEKSLKLKEKIDSKRFTIKVVSGKDGKLYQALTKEKIAEILSKELNETFDKHWIEIDKPIKATGIYNITLNLPGFIKTNIELELIS
ncbi:MAG: 50S ribosomal protein L9 [bacterium]|nr:50S ribosomal protein L9 [bacterium]